MINGSMIFNDGLLLSLSIGWFCVFQVSQISVIILVYTVEMVMDLKHVSVDQLEVPATSPYHSID